MAVTVNNYRITPYSQKDGLAKFIFGGVWGIEIVLPTPHTEGDGYILAVDYERIVYPLAHPVCAWSTQYVYTAGQTPTLAMEVSLQSTRLAEWVSSLRKPTPIYVQIARVRDGGYETLLLDEILALPSVIDGDAYADSNTPLQEALDEKLDKPSAQGAAGQVLTLDESLTPVWMDSQGGGGGNGIRAISVNGDLAPIINRTAYIAITVPTALAELAEDTLHRTVTNDQIAAWSAKQNAISAANKLPYEYISGTPPIPTVGNGTITLTQGGVTKGTFTTNQSGGATIDLDAGGGAVTQQDIIVTTTNALNAEPGEAYDWTPTADATLTLTGAITGKQSITAVNIHTGGNAITLVGITHAGYLVANATNYCGIYFDGASAYLYVYNIVLDA